MKAEEIEGTVLRIERGSIHDGRGLRTVLFLKGCPLSCNWCSTPESQRGDLEVGYVQEKCSVCGTCIDKCPVAALSLADGSVRQDPEKCKRCFTCVDVCLNEARKGYGRLMTVAEAVAELSKDEIFFFHSGGGVTISGGECLYQPDFTAGVLQGCRQRNIDTAVETSLHAHWRNIEKILPFVNDFYVDVKHPDESEHRKTTGVGNSLILENLGRLDASHLLFDLHIRVPLIPGVNDSDQVLEEFISICSGLKKIRDIEILPYHRLGVGTYEQLGRSYKLPEVEIPSQAYIVERTAYVKKIVKNIPIKVGGGYL